MMLWWLAVVVVGASDLCGNVGGWAMLVLMLKDVRQEFQQRWANGCMDPHSLTAEATGLVVAVVSRVRVDSSRARWSNSTQCFKEFTALNVDDPWQ